MSKSKIKLPSMLSFERKLETSDALMYAGNWEDIDNKEAWKNPILIGDPRTNRGTQSMFMKEEKRADTIKPNIVEGDYAALPADKDTLKVSFSIRVIGNLGEPFACNKPDFSKEIKNKVNAFKDTDGIDELALRYAYNIVNGRFLWRNRVGAEDIKIKVTITDSEQKEARELPEFTAYDFSLNDFNKNRNNEYLQKIADVIKNGLISSEENNFVLLKVDAFVKIGEHQQIFPSQEMNMSEKKKKLFQLGGCAAMHNVKIGNAIRTIDTWYGNKMLIKAEGKDKTEVVGIDPPIKSPIAIEPYGSVTQHGRAYRHKDIDLYSLMENWVNDDIEPDQQKFVVANLIRGGVFGGEGEG